MARKRKKPFYEKVLIQDIGSEGKALARVNDIVVFTKLAVPGDIVDMQVIKIRKKYQEAIVTGIHKYSKERITPFCEHFSECGGCKWQNLPYENQLSYKQKQVADQLSRIGKIGLPYISPVIDSQNTVFYRNKLEYTFSNKRWLSREEIESGHNYPDVDSLGFHAPGHFDKVINISKCWLQPDPSNEIRNFIYRYAIQNRFDFFDIRKQHGFLRNLIIRTSSLGETMVIISFFRDDRELLIRFLDAVFDKFPLITSLMYVINPKGNDTINDLEVNLYHGRDHIFEEMDGLKYKIGPKSFFQTNSQQAYNLYKIVYGFAGLSGKEIVYDLYTGIGTIALFVARAAKRVIGIDFIPEAIMDAKENAAGNGIDNVLFYAGDIKETLNSDFVREHGAPDVVITDPPRAGMHKDVVNTILRIMPEKIIYVSCNPATQARDISLMKEKFVVSRIQPIDMFPHTHHIENVVLLEKIRK